MHGEAPPPFDGEEAGLVMKTMRKVICIDAYYILRHPRTVRGSPGHTSLNHNLPPTWAIHPMCVSSVCIGS